MPPRDAHPGVAYRVVDEYEGDTPAGRPARTAVRPLSRGELLGFCPAAWPLREVIAMNELDAEGAQGFIHPSSRFYPQFEQAIREEVQRWFDETGTR